MKDGGEKKYTKGEVSEGFITEINHWVDEEKSRTKKSGHLIDPEFNPKELRPEDEEIWGKVKNSSVTREDVTLYRKGITATGACRSVQIFAEFIANLAMPIILRPEIEEWKKSRKMQ
ncbi:MAG: hypothetical protein V1856_03720 [Candidatus Liptonbacteria bacterium]